jgi:tellurite methyltransferase
MTTQADIYIDIRPESAFLQGHRRDSVHFEGVLSLSERQYELPDTQYGMTIVYESEQEADLLSWIKTKGYLLAKLQLWSSEFKQQLILQQTLAMGSNFAYVWRPSTVVQRFVDEVTLPDAPLLRKGLDIGCGAGRDMVYLAMQGWQMTGVDVRFEMLEKSQRLASRQQVLIHTWQRDCEGVADPFEDLADASVGMINVARYLHRPLFSVFKRLLAPQGYLIYHTFMQGCETFGSPKNPRFLLAPNELAAIFSDYHILWDEVITLADGRPMSAFIARK